MATVVNTRTYPLDLSDGRIAAPGLRAEDVDTDHPHQRQLVLDGHLSVIEGTKPHKRQAERLVDEVTAEPDEEKE